MISVKYYSNWIKEAGRGHLTAVLCWGGFLVYTVFSLLRLSMDTEYSFFGMGSSELLKLCAGLGILLAAAEFFYLLQPAKLDFYYSLPVKKGIIFWCRYVHGLIHFCVPLILSMCICALYECSVDKRFLQAAGSYTMHSILAFGAVFLIFYHLGMFALGVSGRAVSAAGILVLLLFYVPAVFQCVCAVYGRRLFDCFYRIPLWERWEALLSVRELSGKLCAEGIYETQKVWEYVPEIEWKTAAVFWIFISFLVIFQVQKKRKPEAVGRKFVFLWTERAIIFLVSVLAALGAGSVALEVFGLSVSKGIQGVKLAAALTAAGLTALVLVHALMQYLVQTPQSKERSRRRKQFLYLSAEGIAVCAVIVGFLAAAPRFDAYLPDREQMEQMGICVNGVGMSWKECKELTRGRESYTVEEKLKQYRLKEDGLEAVLDWIYDMREEGNGGTDYTFATVCYIMKDGREIYRAYPVDEESFQKFSAVYESTEYKEKAYPAILKEEASEERFIWTDGATEQILELSDEEKDALLRAYQEDIQKLKLEDLRGTAPCGMLKMESQVKGRISRVYVYPFFEETCGQLRQQGIDPEKDLFDYPVRSVYADRTDTSAARRFTEADEIEAWRGRLICRDFDVQTLLCPFKYDEEADVMIEEPGSGAMVEIGCYGIQQMAE